MVFGVCLCGVVILGHFTAPSDTRGSSVHFSMLIVASKSHSLASSQHIQAVDTSDKHFLLLHPIAEPWMLQHMSLCGLDLDVLPVLQRLDSRSVVGLLFTLQDQQRLITFSDVPHMRY